jgi:hypothetical protein
MPEIINVTSEALQAQIRRLLPSQQGFGQDLEATNVITPIIDLTASAEGSALPLELSMAKAFANNTSFSVSNGSATIVGTTGFWSLNAVLSAEYDGNNTTNSLFIRDNAGSTTVIWQYKIETGVGGNHLIAIPFELILFLNSGEDLRVFAGTDCGIAGSIRQVADINGNIINPVGYNPQ